MTFQSVKKSQLKKISITKSYPKIRWAIFLVVAIAALAIRLPQLGERPMHTDESINAYIIGQLLAGKNFQYDPQDRHGPVLAAFTLPLVKWQRAKNFSELTESQVRLAPVLGGTITVLLFGAGAETFGFAACLIAAILFAFAPLPLYYNRYFIHETFFVAATFGLILSVTRIFDSWNLSRFDESKSAKEINRKNNFFSKTNFFICRKTSLAALAGLCAALMLAAKETAVIHFFAIAVAGAIGARAACSRVHSNSPAKFLKFFWFKIILIALAVFLFVTILLFSWFGKNWHNLIELFRIAPQVAARAGGEGHEKPFWYYAVLLCNGWSGAILFALAIAGFLISIFDFARRKVFSPAIFLSIYAIIIFIIYSAIPYKTPWLALNFYLPLAIFAGIAVQKFLRANKSIFVKIVFLIFAALLAFAIFHDTDKWVFQKPADEKNPYAYAHTGYDLLQLPARLSELARENKIANPKIAVVAADPWPLPWYLRKFPQVGFWQPDQTVGAADFFITSPEAAQKIPAQLKNFRPEFFGVRPEVLIILWEPKKNN